MVDQAINAVGNVIKGTASYEAGKFNRSASRIEAVNETRAGVAQEARIRDAAAAQIGQQVAAQGANGFQQGTGSAIDALTQSQINATMDALNVRQAALARSRAAIARGEVADSEGKNAQMVGLIGAASDAVRMGSDWASAKAGQSAPIPSSATTYTGGVGYGAL